jgi:two-component system sensor histidine kinase KdpD
MSRLESGVIQPKKDWCDVNELVCDVIQRLNAELKNHTVKIDINEDLPLFKMDYGLMEQVLYNLVNNATQYTPPQSRILISADCRDEMLVLAIEDNGNGFADEETVKVFEKFYRVKNSPPGGTGLGLSIVKGFVEAHNGSVDLIKGLSGGARFLVKIPAEKIFA